MKSGNKNRSKQAPMKGLMLNTNGVLRWWDLIEISAISNLKLDNGASTWTTCIMKERNCTKVVKLITIMSKKAATTAIKGVKLFSKWELKLLLKVHYEVVIYTPTFSQPLVSVT